MVTTLTLLQRFLFWVQTPLAIVAATGLFFSIPKTFTSGKHAQSEGSITSKLAKVDYFGAVALVRSYLCYTLSAKTDGHKDSYPCFSPLWAVVSKDPLATNCLVSDLTHNIHYHRSSYRNRTYYTHNCHEISRCSPRLHCTAGHYVRKMDGAVLLSSLCNCRTWLVTCFSRVHIDSYKCWVRYRWPSGWLVAH